MQKLMLELGMKKDGELLLWVTVPCSLGICNLGSCVVQIYRSNAMQLMASPNLKSCGQGKEDL